MRCSEYIRDIRSAIASASWWDLFLWHFHQFHPLYVPLQFLNNITVVSLRCWFRKTRTASRGHGRFSNSVRFRAPWREWKPRSRKEHFHLRIDIAKLLANSQNTCRWDFCNIDLELGDSRKKGLLQDFINFDICIESISSTILTLLLLSLIIFHQQHCVIAPTYLAQKCNIATQKTSVNPPGTKELWLLKYLPLHIKLRKDARKYARISDRTLQF